MTLFRLHLRPLAREFWLTPLTALLLVTFGALCAADWQGSPLRMHGARLVWALLLCWSLLGAAVLHGVPGLGWAVAGAAVAAPLGLLPWVGLGAVVMVGLAVPPGILGGLLVLAGRTRKAGRLVASVGIGVTLCSLLALSTSAGCGSLPAVSGMTAAEEFASIARSDQEDRRSACFIFNPDRDAIRRARVKERLHSAQPLPPQALTDAGLVLLHSTHADDLALAHALLLSATAMGHAAAEPLQRVAIDRLRLARGEPQIHGTQWFHAL